MKRLLFALELPSVLPQIVIRYSDLTLIIFSVDRYYYDVNDLECCKSLYERKERYPWRKYICSCRSTRQVCNTI